MCNFARIFFANQTVLYIKVYCHYQFSWGIYFCEFGLTKLHISQNKVVLQSLNYIHLPRCKHVLHAGMEWWTFKRTIPPEKQLAYINISVETLMTWQIKGSPWKYANNTIAFLFDIPVDGQIKTHSTLAETLKDWRIWG